MPGLTRRDLLGRVAERWWLLPVGATAAAFGYMGYYATRVTLGKRAPGAPTFQPGPSVKVASLQTLSQPWDTSPFTYVGRPCVVLHLPRATAGSVEIEGQHYAAFSRVCTHLGCSVNLIKDIEVLAFSFNYRPPDRTPQLGCPCHFSVFDPLKSGEAVFGKAVAPLPRVRLERRGQALWASGIEAAPLLNT